MDKKDLILREAERLFSEKGYYGLGLTELLTACDIPKGSFYYYFPKGKMQLLQETLEYAYRHIAEGLNWSLSQGIPPWRLLNACWASLPRACAKTGILPRALWR